MLSAPASVPRPVTVTQVSSFTATFQNPSSTSIASPSLCNTQQVLLAPATVPRPVTIAQISSCTPIHMFGTPTHVPMYSNVPASAELALSPNSSNASSSSSAPTPSNKTLPSQTVASEGTTTANSVIYETTATEIALGDLEQREQVQPRRVSYLSRISIIHTYTD